MRARSVVRAEVTPGAVLLACSVPILFLHVKYQPGVRVPLRSTHLGIELSDVAVLVVALAAVREGVRRGFEPLRAGMPLWIVSAALLGWMALRTESLVHAVTAAKFAEYALLALSAPLVLRRRADWELVASAAGAWSAVATLVALLQFFGADISDAWPAGRRQPSFLGHSDFAALSALALGIGLAALVIGRRRLGWAPVVAGGAGLVLAGTSAGLVGAAAGALVLLYSAARRQALRRSDVLVAGAVVAVVAAGVLTLRAGDFEQFLRFLHVDRQERSSTANVQTYAHHTLLVYVGYRIWLGHKVTGVGLL